MDDNDHSRFLFSLRIDNPGVYLLFCAGQFDAREFPVTRRLLQNFLGVRFAGGKFWVLHCFFLMHAGSGVMVGMLLGKRWKRYRQRDCSGDPMAMVHEGILLRLLNGSA